MFKNSTYKIKLKFLKTLDQKGLGSLFRTFISSVILVLFFFSMPIFLDHSNNRNYTFKLTLSTIENLSSDSLKGFL